MILRALGLGMGLHSPVTVIWAAAVLVVRAFGWKAEEGKLNLYFPEEYGSYRQKVKTAVFPWWGWAAVLTILAWCLTGFL